MLISIKHVTTGKTVKLDVTKTTTAEQAQNAVETALGLTEPCVLTSQDKIISGKDLVSKHKNLTLLPNPQGG